MKIQFLNMAIFILLFIVSMIVTQLKVTGVA